MANDGCMMVVFNGCKWFWLKMVRSGQPWVMMIINNQWFIMVNSILNGLSMLFMIDNGLKPG